MKLIKICALLIGVSLLVSGCSASVVRSGEEAGTAEETAAPVTSIRAEDDYYGYVNLDTLRNTTVEYGETEAGSFSDIAVEQQVTEMIMRLVNSDGEFPEGSCEQIVRDAYLQFIQFSDDEVAKKDACDQVVAELAKIRDAKTLSDLISVAEELKADYGCATFSNLSVSMDSFDPEKHGISLGQMGSLCGVPLEKVSENSHLGEEYEKRIIDTLQVIGYSYLDAEKVAHDLMLMIIDVAWATDYEIANASNPYAYTSFVGTGEIDTALTNLSAKDFERMAGIGKNPYGGWLVMDKGQLVAMDAVWKDENLDELKAWAAYAFLDQYGAFITTEYSLYEEYFPTSHETLDLQAAKYIDDTFTEALSDLYVKEFYTDEMDRQFTQMCEDIRASYRDMITRSSWLSYTARQGLLEKLDNIKFITGAFCLEQMKDDPSRNAVFGGNVFETKRNSAVKDVQKEIAKIGQPRDRLELGMPMQMVNACYSFDNTVTITVAIMNAPFFDAGADYYTNLGGLGAVVAHEVGHAFDSDMIKYNADGVYDSAWLSPEDVDALEDRNQIAVEYFEKYFSVFDVYHVDGKLTLGENFADLGAVECITNLCKTKDDSIRLFENYARIWCALTLNTDVIEQLSEDPHSPSTIRVNAILGTMDAFYEAYGVEQGDGMYVAPENRISRW